MEVRVLGATGVRRDGVPVDLGTRKQRALLAALTLHRGRPVAVDSIVELLWGDRPPAGAAGSLQVYVAGLRKVLEPARAARAPAELVVTVDPGYALRLPAEAVDAGQLEGSVTRARDLLAPVASQVAPEPGLVATADLDEAGARLADALDLWAGEPYLDLGDAPAAVAERARLDELRLQALELAAVSRLARGEHAAAVPELETLTAAHPLRERLWGLRAVALARSARQAEALDVLREVRTVLADELGLDPGPQLRDLETAVLRQDERLQWSGVAGTGAGAGTGGGTGAGAGASPPQRWPLVGRAEALGALEGLLEEAVAGRPGFALLVGEPGIGKTRLTQEVADRAREQGFGVLVGRCSQDEGAPALWPWREVLRALVDAPDAAGPWPLELADLLADRDAAVRASLTGGAAVEGDAARFRAWDAVIRTLVDASRERPLLVVVDDLHWADASSLGVLRLLAESVTQARVVVVVTRRNRPEPVGTLAAVGEAFARRHALRLDLAGLTAEQAAELVGTAVGSTPSSAQAQRLVRRTHGNPFFLLELGRLALSGASGGELPGAVADVVGRRLEELPPSTRVALRTAAVIGRGFDLRQLANALGHSDDEVLDALDPALDAGVVVEEDRVDAFAFSHAIVQETAYSRIPAARRARLHAAVARAVSGAPGHPGAEGETARHWLAAGPAFAGRAWRAAAVAADAAIGVYAYTEADDWLRQALEAQALDPQAGWLDRYGLLMARTDACRWGADWVTLTALVDEAVVVAREAGDIRRAAAAAVAVMPGALWQPRGHGDVHEPLVVALRRSLRELPAGDDPLRCRVMLGLAAETYYVSGPQEREALVEQSLAMARRLGDRELLAQVLPTAFVATWRPATARQRLGLAEQALALAERSGGASGVAVTSEVERAVALTLLAVARSEVGDVAQARESLTAAMEPARRLRLPFLLLVLVSLEMSWLMMAGELERAEEVHADLSSVASRTLLPQIDDAVQGQYLMLLVWKEQWAHAAGLMTALEQRSPLPVAAPVAAMLVRAGRVDEARAVVARNDLERGLALDDWFSLFGWCSTAEVAFGLRLPELAARAYARLAPYAGWMCSAGSGVAMGPVDAYLAMAAAASGETGLADRHLADAEHWCDERAFPLAAQWVRRQRERVGS